MKLFGELIKCLLIALGSITLYNGGTAVSCNLLHRIFLVQDICPQRKPLREKETGERPQRFPFSQQEVFGRVPFICQLPLNVTPCICCWLSLLVLWAPASPNSLINFFEEGKLFCIVWQARLNLGCLEIF